MSDADRLRQSDTGLGTGPVIQRNSGCDGPQAGSARDRDRLAHDIGNVGKNTQRHGRPWNYYSGVPLFPRSWQEAAMNGIIYLIGLIVVILAILSFFGLR
jgi:hypothetical protein